MTCFSIRHQCILRILKMNKYINKQKQVNPQIIITLHREKMALNIQGSGWKLGEEKDFIFVIEQTIKYFKSDRYKNMVIDSIFKKVKK